MHGVTGLLFLGRFRIPNRVKFVRLFTLGHKAVCYEERRGRIATFQNSGVLLGNSKSENESHHVITSVSVLNGANLRLIWDDLQPADIPVAVGVE
jgi:hypothetical protein